MLHQWIMGEIEDKDGHKSQSAWRFSIDTPIGAISVSDSNEEQGWTPSYKKDEILISIDDRVEADLARIRILLGDGTSYNLTDLLDALFAIDTGMNGPKPWLKPPGWTKGKECDCGGQNVTVAWHRSHCSINGTGADQCTE